MKIVLNGEQHECKGDGSLDGLLKEIGAAGGRVAVMVNGEVVRNADRANVRLKEDDRVEILTMMGGG